MAICFVLAAIGFTSCVTPYLGEATIVPVTNEEAPNNVQGSWNHITLERSWNRNLFYGAQGNFPTTQPIKDSNLYVRSKFGSFRIYGGIQTTPGNSLHQAYFLTGFGTAYSNYREYYTYAAGNALGDSILTSYKGWSQNAFVEGGVKLYKGYVGFRGWQIDADVWHVLHGGIKMVYFNQSGVFNNRFAAPGNLESPVFGLSHHIPQQPALVYPVGFMWLYAGEHMRYFYDFTYTFGNKMFIPLTARIGIGYGF